MSSRLKDKKGFTLVELLIVSGLIAVVLLPISLFFISNINNFYRENDRISAQQEAGNIMDVLTVRVMEARVMEPGEYTAEDGKYVFTTDAGGTWVFDYNRPTLKYNPDKTDTGNMMELSRHVSRFKVEEITVNGETVGINIVLTVTYRKAECTLSNRVYFRNFSSVSIIQNPMI